MPAHAAPAQAWLIDDPQARRQMFPAYFRIFIDHALAAGIVHTTPLGRLRGAGLATTRHGNTCHWQAAQGRDDYLAALITAAFDQAHDPPAVLRAALRTPPGRP
jgi:hypothetical protein